MDPDLSLVSDFIDVGEILKFDSFLDRLRSQTSCGSLSTTRHVSQLNACLKSKMLTLGSRLEGLINHVATARKETSLTPVIVVQCTPLSENMGVKQCKSCQEVGRFVVMAFYPKQNR